MTETIRERIARAIDAADCHSLGFSNRATDAILNILSEPGEEDVRRVYQALWDEFCPGIRSMPIDDEHFMDAARAAIKAYVSGGEG